MVETFELEDEDTTEMRSRADALRRNALYVNDVAGDAFRRRAAELEFMAWLVDLRSGRHVGPVAA